MSKQDYIRIAAAFSRTKPSPIDIIDEEGHTALSQWKDDAEEVALALKADNPQFDSARFMLACTTGE